MSKIEIKDLYLVFGNEKQKALKMLFFAIYKLMVFIFFK